MAHVDIDHYQDLGFEIANGDKHQSGSLADYESSRRFLEAEGLEMRPIYPPERPSFSDVSPDYADPGLESLGLGRTRLGSEPPALLLETPALHNETIDPDSVAPSGEYLEESAIDVDKCLHGVDEQTLPIKESALPFARSAASRPGYKAAVANRYAPFSDGIPIHDSTVGYPGTPSHLGNGAELSLTRGQSRVLHAHPSDKSHEDPFVVNKENVNLDKVISQAQLTASEGEGSMPESSVIDGIPRAACDQSMTAISYDHLKAGFQHQEPRGTLGRSPPDGNIKESEELSEGDFVCEGGQGLSCNKRFQTRSKLSHHARCHKAARNFCTMCDAGFYYMKDLKRHMKTHGPHRLQLIGPSVAGKYRTTPFMKHDLGDRHIKSRDQGRSISLGSSNTFSQDLRQISERREDAQDGPELEKGDAYGGDGTSVLARDLSAIVLNARPAPANGDASVSEARYNGDPSNEEAILKKAHDWIAEAENESRSISNGSDLLSPNISVFDGVFESTCAQSTRPTTNDCTKGTSQALHEVALNDASYAESVQSDGCILGLDATAKVKLSSELASMIFAELGVEVVPDDLTHSIAGLLYDCAAVLQRRVHRNDISHRVAIFMRHRRNMIARELNAEKPVGRAPGLAMGFRERIALLMSKEGLQGMPDDIDHSNIQDLADEDEMKQPEVQEARAFLGGSAEFTWLLVRLKALCQLEMTGETHTSVRQTICRSLESGRRDYSFSLNWCPLAFMTSQYPPGTKLSQVICVNGDATRAQATTCEQYVTQTWPGIGPAVLEHLDKYVETGTSSLGTGSARRNFEMHIQRLPNDSTCIKVIADPNVVLEIGEVLAWLIVACRAGDLKEAAAPTSVLSSPRVSSSLDGNFEISWTSEPLAQSSCLSEETCWHDLFNSCSIAQGYPIPRRTQNEPGLELSLGLISMLGAASRAVLFDSVLLLKGLCSMFVPIQKAGASVIWHYLVHRDEYGNFSDWMPHYKASHGREPLRSLDFSDLVDCPQYVGWSRETKMVAGSEDARYDEVDFGGKPIKPGFALDGVSISISKVLSVGTKAVAGKKDTPMFQCASGPYEQTINITAKWTALMYDTVECRGWLLDGATALLHMCRAAMTHPDAPEIGRGLPKSPVDSFTYAGANTDAKDILLDKQNRELIIYDDKEKPWTFEDLVLQHWGTFEEMKSHHFKLRAGETKQWEFSNPLSRRLEGFGFVDILTREPCMPRYHSLSSQASRWLQFTTQCGAINILGSGFGNLIAPLTSCKKTLEALPCGHDLIAAPVGLLHRIARRIGLVSASFIELCDGVYWNDPSRSFASDPCQCIESPQKDLMWRCGGGITSLEGRAGVNNCKRRRLVEMVGDYSRGAIILGGRSSRFDDRLCVENSEAPVPVSPQSGKRRAVDEGYSSSRS